MNNSINGVTMVQNMALVYAITHLEGYRNGESSMQKYYFPIRNLSEAIIESDNYIDGFENESGLTL